MSGSPLRATVVVTNPQGFHMRPMAAFAELAARYQSDVAVRREDVRVNGKSILDLMRLAAEQGTELTVEADGADAAAALDALVALMAAPPEEDTPDAPTPRAG
jgi:phosphotransferase system HPr (HPr) family protein